KDGWYDGDQWRHYDGDWRYRDQGYRAITTYAPPRAYTPPTDYRAIVFEPGMRLPSPYYREDYYIEHDRYGLPPPPPRHRWVQVDDDVVLVAIASGLVADFVYDLFD
ncbi:MAG TPA: RcnB family protein, partial [Xanthomonadaceae bacterium]|nr:RcnB family protein [Xanthomonadaceae bacterium]